jgi:PBP1b-binding outer membrane lipoprotein LpoB
MRIYIAVLSVLMLLISGCATTQTTQQKAEIKRITPEELEALTPAPIATYTIDQMVADSKQGKTSEEIIAAIKESDSRYDLSTAQILGLHKQGVDTEVLAYIQESNKLAEQNAIADEINKREIEKRDLEKRLYRERRLNNLYDPFWGRGYGFYGRPYWGRFGWRYGPIWW